MDKVLSKSLMNDSIVDGGCNSKKHFRSSMTDVVGVFLSALCLVHCICTPLLIIFLPGIDLHQFEIFHSNEVAHGTHQMFNIEHYYTHIILGVLILYFGLVAFYSGYKIHGNKYIMFAGYSGFFMLLLGVLTHEVHIASYVTLGASLTVLGSLLLVFAHVVNIQKSSQYSCKTCSS